MKQHRKRRCSSRLFVRQDYLVLRFSPAFRRAEQSPCFWIIKILWYNDLYHTEEKFYGICCVVRVRLAKQETYSSRAPGLTSGLQGSVNLHRGALLLVSQWQCISSFVFSIFDYIGRLRRYLSNHCTSIYLHFCTCLLTLAHWSQPVIEL